jgi:hypothetical protein
VEVKVSSRDSHEYGAQFQRLRMELQDLAQNHALTEQIREIEFHDTFPVDIRHNAKIFREKLAVWATDVLAEKKHADS